MGFLDRFGVGGGKLEVHPSASQVTPGSALTGTVSFTAGSRAQQITNIKAKLAQNLVHTVNTPQGPQQRHETHTIGPEVVLSNAFTSAPGQRYDFHFEIHLPPSLPNSIPGQASYRLAISADIDGEIDPGTGFDIQVFGGASASAPQAPQAQWGGQTAQAGFAQGGFNQGGFQQGGFQQSAPMSPPMPPSLPAIGTALFAQWQDGNFHPARVVQHHGNMIGVDWDNPQLGQSSWVQLHQLQIPPPPPMMSQPMMSQPMSHQHDMEKAMIEKKAMLAKSSGGGLMVGSSCYALWKDGNVYPAKIIQISGDNYAVDWDDAKLGAATWVTGGQIKPR